jgi:H+/Cl- antiporter ClcA
MTSKPKYSGLGMALGATLGVALGLVVGHVGAWLPIGVAIGMLLGASFRRKRAADCPRCAELHRTHELHDAE